MKIMIGATKGGNGKSLLSCNLAAKRASEGFDVLLLDGDKQGSSSLWAELTRLIHPSPSPGDRPQKRGWACVIRPEPTVLPLLINLA